jgi:sugar-specific transcriptional regulator TrmB
MREKLVQLGLTEREAGAYDALLSFDEATATQIAAITKEHRTNVYDSLQGLIKKGLIVYTIKNNVKHFALADPQKLVTYIEEKEVLAKEVLPLIQKRRQSLEHKPRVEVYEGREGFKSILNHMLAEKKTIYGIGASEEWEKRFPFALSQYMKKRQKKNIKAKLLYTKGCKPLTHRMNTIKFLPKMFSQPSTVAIYGEYVAVFMWTDPLVATVTQSSQLARSFKHYFDVLWKISE